MKITVLGSGAWEGVPAPFCGCNVCTLATQNLKSKDNRTRPQLLVENAGARLLVEISPDIRTQSARFGLPLVKDFVVSHWHFDHMYGIHELMQYSKDKTHGLNIYCSKGTQIVLSDDEFTYVPSTLHIVEPLKSFELAGITVTPLPVYHMRAQDDAIPENQLANTFGYLFERDGKRVAYLADYCRVPQAVIDKIQGCDIVLCEGTYLLTDDYRSYKPNHMHGQDIIRFAESIEAKQVYYMSVSHLTHKTHEEMEQMLPSGHKLAYDGLVVTEDLE